MAHRHTIVQCEECDTLISQCRCMAKDKTIIYEMCNKCRINDLLGQAQEYKRTGRVKK